MDGNERGTRLTPRPSVRFLEPICHLSVPLPLISLQMLKESVYTPTDSAPAPSFLGLN